MRSRHSSKSRSYGRHNHGRSYSRHYGHRRYGHRYYPHRRYYRPYYGHYGHYSPWRYGFYGYHPWGYSRVYVHSDASRQGRQGALDLDISPEEAEIYLNGQLIGVADDFDGFPTHLWLSEGTYDLVVYKPGYETIARQYSIYPGVVIEVDDEMRQGEAVRPEDLIASSADRSDERLRERSYDDRKRDYERERVADAARQKRVEAGSDDRDRDIARLHLAVEPRDAAIYLDGHFLGTGEELGRISAGLVIDPGEHELEIVRPGYQTKARSLELDAGQRLDLEIELPRGSS